jgi:hypothetical protein
MLAAFGNFLGISMVFAGHLGGHVGPAWVANLPFAVTLFSCTP